MIGLKSRSGVDVETQSRQIGEWVVDRSVPTPKTRAPKKTKYPFAGMEVGESFKVLPMKSDNCRSAANQFCRRHQMTWKFSVGISADEKAAPPFVHVYRCWRVK